MLLHVACYYHFLSQIHNRPNKLVFTLGFTKTESLEPSEFLKKGSLLAEKLCSEFVHLKQIIINF